MKTRDLNDVKCIKDEDQNVQYKIRLKRWKNYFNKLLNESNTKDWSVLSKPIGDRNFRVI